MFRHDKHLLESVNVEQPNPQYDARLYFDLSSPQGKYSDLNFPQPPDFQNPQQ